MASRVDKQEAQNPLTTLKSTAFLSMPWVLSAPSTPRIPVDLDDIILNELSEFILKPGGAGQVHATRKEKKQCTNVLSFRYLYGQAKKASMWPGRLIVWSPLLLLPCIANLFRIILYRPRKWFGLAREIVADKKMDCRWSIDFYVSSCCPNGCQCDLTSWAEELLYFDRDYFTLLWMACYHWPWTV